MPSAQGIRAGLAYVELYANSNPLVQGLNAASAKLKAFGQSISSLGLKMTAAGASIVTPILAATKDFADFGSKLNDMSARTGVSVEALSEIGYAAQLSGSSLEDVEAALRKMQRTVVSAGAGSQSAADALSTLGLNAQQLANLSPEDQFTEIAKRLNDIPDPTQKAAAAMGIFGKSGTQLLPLIGDMAALREEARRLGITMSAEDVAAADALGDAFDKIKAVLRSVATTIGSAVAPLLLEWADWLANIISGTRKWLSENRGLIVSALKIGAVVVAVGAGLVALGTIISTIGSVFGALATIITGAVGLITGTVSAAISIIGGIGTAFSVVASVVGTAVGFILTPVGALIVALVALGGYLIYASGIGGKVVDYLGDRFNDLKDAALQVFADIKDFALQSFEGIKDALAAGDIALAAKILWLSLQVAWKKGIAVLTKYWRDFTSSVDKIFTDAFYGLVLIGTDVFYDLQEAWALTTKFFADLLDDFIGFFYKAWNEAVGWLAKKIAYLASFFDESFDLDAVTREIDNETTRLNRARETQDKGAADARNKAIAEIEQERNATIAEINKEADAVDAAREKSDFDAIGKAEEELSQARKEWADALAQAKSERENAEQPTVEKAKDNIRGSLPELETAQSKLDVFGTFNATAAASLGFGNSATERTAKATEETARNTKRMLQKMDEDELTFD
jgi:hypothetical protein